MKGERPECVTNQKALAHAAEIDGGFHIIGEAPYVGFEGHPPTKAARTASRCSLRTIESLGSATRDGEHKLETDLRLVSPPSVVLLVRIQTLCASGLSRTVEVTRG